MENTPLDSMFLFQDKEYEKLCLLNQVSIYSIIFANEHYFWLFGAHELKHISSWLVRFRNHDNSQVICENVELVLALVSKSRPECVPQNWYAVKVPPSGNS